MELGRVVGNGSCMVEGEGVVMEVVGCSKLVSKVGTGEEGQDVAVVEGGGTG